MRSFRRILWIAVALMLALPGVAVADPGITVQSVSTDKPTYAAGDPIHFTAQINNSLGGWLLAQGHCSATSFPVCLSISTSPSFFSDGQSADFPPGLSTWTWTATAPIAPGTYSFTVQAWDGFYGNFGAQTGSFTVTQPTLNCPTSPSVTFSPNLRAARRDFRHNRQRVVAGWHGHVCLTLWFTRVVYRLSDPHRGRGGTLLLLRNRQYGPEWCNTAGRLSHYIWRNLRRMLSQLYADLHGYPVKLRRGQQPWSVRTLSLVLRYGTRPSNTAVSL